jgi:hypothetical protein
MIATPVRSPARRAVALVRAALAGHKLDDDCATFVGELAVDTTRLDSGEKMAGPPIDIRLSPTAALYVSVSCIAVLAAAGLVAALIEYRWMGPTEGDITGNNLLDFFNLNEENNLPTFFTLFLFLSCFLALSIISVQKRATNDQWAARWMILAIIFILLPLDEFAGVHELVGYKLRVTFDLGGWLYYAWVLPGAVFVGLFGLYYITFLRSLPRETAGLMLAAGAVYVGGAIGMEVFAGRYAEINGKENMTFQMVSAAEEALEMLGLAVFLFSLLRYLSDGRPDVRIVINPPR